MLSGHRGVQRVEGRRAREVGARHDDRPFGGERGEIAVHGVQEVHDAGVVDRGVGAVGQGEERAAGAAAQPDHVPVLERQGPHRAFERHRARPHLGVAGHLGQQAVVLPQAVLPGVQRQGGRAHREVLRVAVPDHHHPVQEDAGAVHRDHFRVPPHHRRRLRRVGEDGEGAVCRVEEAPGLRLPARGDVRQQRVRLRQRGPQRLVRGVVLVQGPAQRVLTQRQGDGLAVPLGERPAGGAADLRDAGPRRHHQEARDVPHHGVRHDPPDGFAQHVLGERGTGAQRALVGGATEGGQFGDGALDLLGRHELAGVAEVPQLGEDQGDEQPAVVGVQDRVVAVVHADGVALADGLALGGAAGEDGGPVLARGRHLRAVWKKAGSAGRWGVSRCRKKSSAQ
ncbi:hypothetical protein SCALM49S_08823 [Streptomyces californicus]